MRSPCRERDQRFQKRISARWRRAQNSGRDLCTENASNVFKSGFPHVGREHKIVDAISVRRTRPTFSKTDFRTLAATTKQWTRSLYGERDQRFQKRISAQIGRAHV